jgi:PAS domain S-box-containing protein
MGLLVRTVRLVRMAIEVRYSPILKILKNLQLGAWIYYPKDQYLWVSEGFSERLNITVPEKIGTITDLKHLISYEDIPLVFKAIVNTQREDAAFNVAFRVKENSGTDIWLNANGNQIVDRKGALQLMFGTITEITRQREEQERLHRSVYFLDEVWRMAKVAGWQYSVETDELFVSPELAELVELSEFPKSVGFKDALKYFHPEDRSFTKRSFFKSIKDKNYFSFETRVVTEKGHKRWVKVKGDNIFNEVGDLIEVRGVIGDITKHKTMEILQAKNILDLKSKNKQLVEYGEIASHNLRAPLSSVEMLCEAFEVVATLAEKQEILENIKACAHTSLQAVDSLYYSVKNITDNKLKPVLLNVEVMWQSVFWEFEKPEDLEISMQTNFTVKEVEFDEVALSDILLGFLSNSIKYCNENKKLKISVETHREAERTTLCFRDNGLGIDMKKDEEKLFGLNRIFHSNLSGSGVSLFMAKKNIEALGGSIEAKSVVGKGTTFIVYF